MAAADDLKVQLEEACEDLWWSSESDYPVEVVWNEERETASADDAEPSADALRKWLLSSSAKIESPDELTSVDIEGFFEGAIAPQGWHTAEDKAQITQLQRLKDLLVRSLHPLRVYRYGEVEVLVYVLGYTPAGNIAGVTTCLVET